MSVKRKYDDMAGEITNKPEAASDTLIWRTPDGMPVSCTEKIKVLNENMEELRELIKDALDDALVMGCDVNQFRSAIAEMVHSLESSFTKRD